MQRRTSCDWRDERLRLFRPRGCFGFNEGFQKCIAAGIGAASASWLFRPKLFRLRGCFGRSGGISAAASYKKFYRLLAALGRVT